MTCIICLINDWIIFGRPSFRGPTKRSIILELDSKFGEGNWKIGYLLDGKFLSHDSLLLIIEESYHLFFKNNPKILEQLLFSVKGLYETTTVNDQSAQGHSAHEFPSNYFAIAIKRVLKRLGHDFQEKSLPKLQGGVGEDFILSPEQVPFCCPEKILRPTLKGRWQKQSIASFLSSNRVLAVKGSVLKKMGDKIIGIVLRKDIRMGKGKFCAQAAHALVSLQEHKKLAWNFHSNPVEIWSVSSEAHLLGLYHQAQKLKICCSLIRDAGKTQLQPGTYTAVALGAVNAGAYDILMHACNAKPLEVKPRTYCLFTNFHLVPFIRFQS